MARRQLKSDDVDGFMVAAWHELRDVEAIYHVTVTLDFRPGDRAGKWGFYARATRVDDEGHERVAGMAEVLWPTNKATSLHALVYALLMRLWSNVNSTYANEPWEADSAADALARTHR